MSPAWAAATAARNFAACSGGNRLGDNPAARAVADLAVATSIRRSRSFSPAASSATRDKRARRRRSRSTLLPDDDRRANSNNLRGATRTAPGD